LYYFEPEKLLRLAKFYVIGKTLNFAILIIFDSIFEIIFKIPKILTKQKLRHIHITVKHLSIVVRK